MPAISDALFTVDEGWRITSFNKGAEELMSLRAQEVVGRNCRDAFRESGRFEDLCSLYGPLASGRAMNDLRLVILKPDSEEKQVVLATAIPLPGRAGGIGGAVIALRDASDPSLIYPLVLDSIADGVFSVDRNMRITSFNKAAEQITGWTAQEVIGSPCSDIFHSSICGETCILAQSVHNVRSLAKRNVFIRGKN
ncbi:MAG: PAS domain-containing protein, partial [Desulfobacteraceae bacterium]|nr:PAS domain-containing protein [Desulfobacteraceae bacterium]